MGGAAVNEIVGVVAAAAGNRKGRSASRALLHDKTVKLLQLRGSPVNQRQVGDAVVFNDMSDGR